MTTSKLHLCTSHTATLIVGRPHKSNPGSIQAMVANITNINTLKDTTINYTYLCAFSTASEHKDTLNYGEIIRATKRDIFNGHANSCDFLYVIPRSKIPEGFKPLPAVWSFKHRIFHTGLRANGKQGLACVAVDNSIIREGCFIIVYVDDCLLFSPQDSTLESILSHLNKLFKLTSDANIGAYLGIRII
jgi:hypothetical protein